MENLTKKKDGANMLIVQLHLLGKLAPPKQATRPDLQTGPEHRTRTPCQIR